MQKLSEMMAEMKAKQEETDRQLKEVVEKAAGTEVEKVAEKEVAQVGVRVAEVARATVT